MKNAIIPGMFLRLSRVSGLAGLVYVSLAGAAGTLAAHPLQSQIVIEEDPRVFVVMAALNVAGYDVELGSQYHPVRVEIRKIADNLDPDFVDRLRSFYDSHKDGGSDDEQLAKYISLAVVLGDAPTFKVPDREESVPDDVRSILGFAAFLPEFYQKAAIPRVWASVSLAYEAEMDLMGPPIRDALSKSDSYMRASSGGRLAHSMRISVELSAPQNSVNVRSDGEEYYVVLGYANTPKVDEVRHAYLHLRLNDYAGAAASKVEKGSDLASLLQGIEGVEREYSLNFESLFTESLIRAIELRIDREPTARAEQRLKTYYRSGLLLAPYFYQSLAGYEAGDDSLRDYVGTVTEAIDISMEHVRFVENFHSIPLPEREPVRAEVPPAPVVDPVLELLKSAQAVFEQDKGRAREMFEKILREYDPNNGRALYGIGLIEMDRENLDEALGYFERTIASGSAEPSMTTWSHIYAGHILDFKCNRDAAVAHYRKAVESGDDTRNAQKTANRDLLQPFGGECRQ